MKKILCLLLLLAIAFSLTACIFAETTKTAAGNAVVYADKNNAHYISLRNGEIQSLGAAKYASVSPNGKYVACAVNTTGETPKAHLYLRDPESGEWSEFDRQNGEVREIHCNDHIVFVYIAGGDQDRIAFYDITSGDQFLKIDTDAGAMFSMPPELEMGIASGKIFAEDTTQKMFFNNNTSFAFHKDGSIYLLENESSSLKKIDGTYESANLLYVSGNANALLFTDSEESATSVHLWKDGVMRDLSGVLTASEISSCTGSAGGNWIIPGNAEKVHLIHNGKIIGSANVRSDGYSIFGYPRKAFTDHGPLCAEQEDAEGIYLPTADGIYYFDQSGRSVCVLPDVSKFRIQNQRVCYCKGNSLYVAPIQKGSIGSSVLLSDSVDSYDFESCVFSEDGKYLYFIADNTLFAYREGDDTPLSVASDISYYAITRDGKTAIYLNDREYQQSKNLTTYSLRRYDFGKTNKLISFDVMSVNACGQYIDAASLEYTRYSKTVVDKNFFGLVRYDGDKSTVLFDRLCK